MRPVRANNNQSMTQYNKTTQSRIIDWSDTSLYRKPLALYIRSFQRFINTVWSDDLYISELASLQYIHTLPNNYTFILLTSISESLHSASKAALSSHIFYKKKIIYTHTPTLLLQRFKKKEISPWNGLWSKHFLQRKLTNKNQ